MPCLGDRVRNTAGQQAASLEEPRLEKKRRKLTFTPNMAVDVFFTQMSYEPHTNPEKNLNFPFYRLGTKGFRS